MAAGPAEWIVLDQKAGADFFLFFPLRERGFVLSSCGQPPQPGVDRNPSRNNAGEQFSLSSFFFFFRARSGTAGDPRW